MSEDPEVPSKGPDEGSIEGSCQQKRQQPTPGDSKSPDRVEAVGALSSVSTQSAPEGIRTPNLLIRSQMLYPLSYGLLLLSGRVLRNGR